MMVGLVDIAPLTSMVLIRGQDIIITGVSARGIALLLARFPELRAVMTGREVALDDLLKLGGDVIAAIIAAGTGAPGDVDAERAADNLTLEEQADLLGAIVELTMPRGLGPLVEKLSRLGLLAGGGASVMQAATSPLPSKN
jgi:hypothetical protein